MAKKIVEGPARGTFSLHEDMKAPTPEPQAVNDSAQLDQSLIGNAKPINGLTYIIRSVFSGEVITMLDGGVTLTEPDSPGSIEWVCEEKSGIYGFRNRASGTYLGHNGFRQLRSWVTWHKAWESFKVLERPAGFLLTMAYWWTDLPIGVTVQEGTKQLAMVDSDDVGQLNWEFIEVDSLKALCASQGSF